MNVNEMERLLSAVGGVALAMAGAKRRGLGGAALAAVGGVLLERGVTGHCRVYDALGMNTAERGMLEQQHGPSAVLDASRAIKVEQAVTVNRPRMELYDFWRRVENLPRVMPHVESVDELSPTRSRWRVAAPAGQTVEYDAEIFNEIPGELIAWKSVGEAAVPNAGSVRFADAPGGATEVRLVVEYEPPAGRVGLTVARLFGREPEARVRDDLRRFKQIMEEA